MLLLMQRSVQLPGMPGELRRAIEIAQSLSGPDDGAGDDGLPLLRGGPVHGGSLVCDPDDAAVHVGVGLAGSRGDQWRKSCAVCPIRIQIEPPHLDSPLFLFERWRADLLSTDDKRWRGAGTTQPCLYMAFLRVGNDSQSLVPIPRTNKSLTRHFAATSKLPPP